MQSTEILGKPLKTFHLWWKENNVQLYKKLRQFLAEVSAELTLSMINVSNPLSIPETFLIEMIKRLNCLKSLPWELPQTP